MDRKPKTIARFFFPWDISWGLKREHPRDSFLFTLAFVLH
jgi:hypothetical protein